MDKLLKNIAILGAAVVAAWLLSAVVAGMAVGPEGVVGASLAAGICFVAGIAVLLLMDQCGKSVGSILGGMMLRFSLVAIGGLLVFFWHGGLDRDSFLLCLAFIYMAAMAAETWVTVGDPTVKVVTNITAGSAWMILADGTFHHVYDFFDFELPFGLKPGLPHGGPLNGDAIANPANAFGFTKFMLLQIVAVILVMYVFKGLASRVQGGKPVQGWFWNFWEMLAVYIRDNVVRPVIGDPHAHHHDDHGQGDHAHEGGAAGHVPAVQSHDGVVVGHPADKYLPYVWSVFFYVLFCNLLGALPWLGSATGDINVTGALAVVAFIATFVYGAQMHGAVGFFTHMIPSIDAPPVLKQLLSYGIFGIEVIGVVY